MTERSYSKTRYYQTISDSHKLFWILQCSGWLGVSLMTYLSLSLPYSQFELSYLAHNFVQSGLGLALSTPLRTLYRRVWHWLLWPRLVVIMIGVVSAALFWAVLRLLLFMLFTGERDLWGDFGGWLFPAIFIFSAWAALYHGIKYYQLLQREHEQLLALEAANQKEALFLVRAQAEARDAQLKLLRYQINPHFLFNTLNSVSALINKGRATDAEEMLTLLSDFLRYSLDGDANPTVSVSEELASLERYLAIEKVRFRDRLTVEVNCDPAVASIAVPSLLLQPLVENAIKHAIAPSVAGGRICVTAELQNDRLVLKVEDSGSDQSEVSIDRVDSTGIGLANTRARLEQVFGENAALRNAVSELGGMKFVVDLPCTIASGEA